MNSGLTADKARAAVEALSGKRKPISTHDNIPFSREVRKTFEAATNVSAAGAAGEDIACWHACAHAVAACCLPHHTRARSARRCRRRPATLPPVHRRRSASALPSHTSHPSTSCWHCSASPTPRAAACWRGAACAACVHSGNCSHACTPCASLQLTALACCVGARLPPAACLWTAMRSRQRPASASRVTQRRRRRARKRSAECRLPPPPRMLLRELPAVPRSAAARPCALGRGADGPSPAAAAPCSCARHACMTCACATAWRCRTRTAPRRWMSFAATFARTCARTRSTR